MITTQSLIEKASYVNPQFQSCKNISQSQSSAVRRSEWDEFILEQQVSNIESELSTERESLIVDQQEFEDRLRNRDQSLEDLNLPQTETFKLNNSPRGSNVSINSLKTVKRIYLEIKTDHELTIQEKHSIITTCVTVIIGGQRVTDCTIASALLQMTLRKEHIRICDDRLIIPLMYLDDNSDGFPLNRLKYHAFDIRIDHLNIRAQEINLLCEGLLRATNDFCTNRFKFITMRTDVDTSYIPHGTSFKSKIDPNLIKKYIIFFLIPPIDTDFWEYTENQPLIESIDLIIDDRLPWTFDESDLLSVEFLGIKIYVLPLSPEMKTWEQAINMLNEQNFKGISTCGINFSKVDYKKLYLQVHADRMLSGYQLFVEMIGINVLKFGDGMMTVAYAF